MCKKTLNLQWMTSYTALFIGNGLPRSVYILILNALKWKHMFMEIYVSYEHACHGPTSSLGKDDRPTYCTILFKLPLSKHDGIGLLRPHGANDQNPGIS